MCCLLFGPYARIFLRPLRHGGSEPGLTSNSDYCCCHFPFGPSRMTVLRCAVYCCPRPSVYFECPVDEPTDWVSQMSVGEKKSGIRICIDSRPLNKVLKHEHYKLPVLEDILPELSQACKFSVCDLKSGYLHCKLDYSSSLLTTFATPFGRYRWCRLLFGLTASREIFEKRYTRHWKVLEESTTLLMMKSSGVTQMKNMTTEYTCSYNAAARLESH